MPPFRDPHGMSITHATCDHSLSALSKPAAFVAALCRDDSAGVFTYLSFRYVVRRVVEGFARKNLLLCGCCRCFTSFQHDRCAILLNLY